MVFKRSKRYAEALKSFVALSTEYPIALVKRRCPLVRARARAHTHTHFSFNICMAYVACGGYVPVMGDACGRRHRGKLWTRWSRSSVSSTRAWLDCKRPMVRDSTPTGGLAWAVLDLVRTEDTLWHPIRII